MKLLLRALVLSVVAGFVVPGAQSPSPQLPVEKPQAPPPTKSPAPSPPAQKPATRPQSRATGGATLSIQVTDMSGNPLNEVSVSTDGPVDRAGTTGQDGRVAFRSMRAGTYRLRFEHDGFITLERDVVMRNQAADVSVALTAAPAPPKPEPPPPVEKPTPPPPRPARNVQPNFLSIADYLDDNLIGSQAMKSSLLACAEGGTAVLLQIRDPQNDRRNDDADEILYVVAGAGILRLGEKEIKLPHGYFALIPRGTTSSLRRDGRVPMIAISILAGAPCTESGPMAR